MLDELSRVADLIRDDVLDSPAVALALTDLSIADAYTHAHSLNVAVTGTLIGRRVLETHGWIDRDGQRRFDRRKWRLSRLALGLLLHDLGKLAVPATVLDKPGRLDAHEWALVRQHPEAGVHLLTRGVPPLAREVVRAHHERWDGTGYPRGLSGGEIHQLARIATVADVYDAVTSDRAYARAEPPHVGVSIVRAGAGTQFDPAVVDSFRRVVMPYPPGHEIELGDGRIGVVASVDPREPERPVVRVPVEDGFEEVELEMAEAAQAA
jgi:HD-GYP domain-containing protein (c-di-GMP phosphodiesterase class II)